MNFRTCIVSNFANGKEIIDELCEIGDLNGGTVHCILSGGNDLRELAFGGLSQEKKGLYGNYSGRCLNSTKFVHYPIHPFCNRNDFIRVMNHMIHGFHPNITRDTYAPSSSTGQVIGGTQIELLSDNEWNNIFIQTDGMD